MYHQMKKAVGMLHSDLVLVCDTPPHSEAYTLK